MLGHYFFDVEVESTHPSFFVLFRAKESRMSFLLATEADYVRVLHFPFFSIRVVVCRVTFLLHILAFFLEATLLLVSLLCAMATDSLEFLREFPLGV